MTAVAETISLSLDRQKLSVLENLPANPQKDIDYQSIRSELIKMGKVDKKAGVKLIYSTNKRGADIVYSIDSSTDADHREPGEVYRSPNQEVDAAIKKAWGVGTTSFVGPFTDQQNTYATVVVPIQDFQKSKVASVIGVDIDYALVLQNINAAKRMPLLITLACLIIFYSFLIFRGSLKRNFFIGFLILIGMGILWAIFAPYFLLKLTSTFSYDANLISHDNLYDNQMKSFSPAIESASKFSSYIVKEENNVLTIKSDFNVRTLDGQRIFTAQRLYGISAYNKDHVIGYGDHDRHGYLVGPPSNSKEDFIYWHVNYDTPILMIFTKEETIEGMRVFRFDGNVSADQSKELSYLPGVPDLRKILTNAHVSLWIEPYSGWLIKYEDSGQVNFVDGNTGKYIEPWNKYTNVFTDKSVTDQVKIAQEAKNKIDRSMIAFPLVSICAFTLLLYLCYRLKIDFNLMMIGSLFAIVGLCSVFILFASSKENTDQKLRDRLEVRAQTVQDQVTLNLNRSIEFLIGTRAHLYSKLPVNGGAWSEYISGSEVIRREKGVRVIGYISRVQNKDKEKFQLQIQSEKTVSNTGYKHFHIYPNGERSEYFPVTYIEPFLSNELALGYDLNSEPTRIAALNAARDSGKPSITGIINLVQDDENTPGFVLLVPVYKNGFTPITQVDRRNDLIGYVYAGFRADVFFRNALSASDTEKGVDLEVYDDDQIDQSHLLYDGDPRAHAIFDDTFPVKNSRKIDVVNRIWGFHFFGTKDFIGSDFEQITPYIILIVGSLLFIAVWLIFWQLSTINNRARALAERITNELNSSQKELTLKNSILQNNERILNDKVLDDEKRKRAMLNLLEDIQAEKNENELQASIIKNTDEAVIAEKLDGTITSWNQGAEKLYGYSTAEIIGKSAKILAAPDRDDISQLLEQIAKGERIPNYSTTRRRKDGALVEVSITLSPIKDVSGHIIGASILARDVTKEKDIDRMKTEFVSLASHQLRTPLSAIRWFCEMLINGDAGQLNPEQKDYMQNISDSNRRMTDLVNSLLNISRIESGRLTIDPKPTDLKVILDQLIADLRPKINEKEQQLIINVNENLPLVDTDPKLIQQVFLNLLTNAIKYSPKNSEISIFISRKDEEVVVQVSDTGYGIPVKDQSRIFEKFYRAENIAQVEADGTGLGLYLVKTIINSTGGKIWFTSEEGHGSSFFFSLPLNHAVAKKGEVTLNS